MMFLFFILMRNTSRNAFMTLGVTFMTICYHFTVRLVIGEFAGRINLESFDFDAGRFREFGFERKLYRALRVRKWKKFIPTYDEKQFSFKECSLGDLARATCRAEVTHWLCILASLATIFFSTWFGSTAAFVITGIFGALIDLVFVIVQRYNRPRLLKAQKRRNG